MERWHEQERGRLGEPCRLGLIALGDSITKGDGEPVLGVSYRSWSLWLAEALDVPYTNRAVDAAVASELVRDQLPRVQTDYDLACLYIGVNDARGPDWDADRFAAALDAALGHLRARASRVLTLTIPLDLGRPRAGTAVPVANALIRRLAGEHDAVCADLSDLRGWRLVLPDAVHPTALGQLQIADRAAAALAAAGAPVTQSPSALADADESRRAGASFAIRWGSLLARDLVRRRLEAIRLRG
jgi:lysophospholipase L1-like esterase